MGLPLIPPRSHNWPAGVDPRERFTVTAGADDLSSPHVTSPCFGALEDQGIQVEAACRSGECSLCGSGSSKGKSTTGEEARLRLSDSQFGYTHSCVAYPLTNTEIDI